MKICAIAAVLLLMQRPAPEQGRKGRIEGQVLRAGTNEPIENARVTIRSMGGLAPTPAPAPAQTSDAAPETPEAVTTDSQGRFVFDNITPGSYELAAVKNGFARQVYGERAPGRPGTRLTISAGQTLNGLVFRLGPTAAVSGRVTDMSGDAIPGIFVQLQRTTYTAEGRRTFAAVSNAWTNDRGEYRMYLITPGRYFVTAGPALSVDPSAMADNRVDQSRLVLTYYPGVGNPAEASSIDLEPGAETSAIDFRLASQPLFRIRGRVFDARSGNAPRNVQLMIHARSPESPGFHSGVFYNGANGTFEVRNVPPGSYSIEAQLIPDTFDLRLSIADLLKNAAQARVDVSNADVENVVVTFSPGFSVHGRVQVEDSANRTSKAPLIVMLQAQESTPAPPFLQPVNPDGTFMIDGVLPGEYRVHVQADAESIYIKSARLGGADVLSGFSLSGPASESLEIVLSGAFGSVEGRVLDERGNPAPGVQVVLIPNRQRSQTDHYRTAITDQNGRFMMSKVVPGEYKAFAWEDLEPFAYYDPDFLGRYEQRGAAIMVSESSNSTIETKMIPAGL